MRGGGNGDVPKGLDWPTFFLLMDGLDRRHHALAEAVGQELARLASTCFLRASSIAWTTGLALACEYSRSTGVTSSSHRSGAPLVWRIPDLGSRAARPVIPV